MRVTKPDFYDDFKCIAGDCQLTCCQQWHIGMDDATYDKWKKNLAPSPLEPKKLSQYTRLEDDQRVIDFGKDKVCPFLDGQGLCNLVTSYGDDILSRACQIFPRERHEFNDVTELSLMPCCPEVVDMFNRASSFRVITADGLKVEGYRKLRDYLVDLVQDQHISLEHGLLASFYILRYQLLEEEIYSQAFLDAFRDKLGTLTNSDLDMINECNEIFLDLTDNYRASGMYASYLQPLWDLANQISDGEHIALDSYEDFRSAFNHYEELLRKIMAGELYADLLTPGASLDTMIIRLEWIELLYVMIRHMCYLSFAENGELPYATVRQMIVLASRMMGYEEDYIFEYMEDAFEDSRWEWSYLFLLIGQTPSR